MASIYREVKNFQDDLKQAGMYDGPITGRYDAATHEAAKKMVASGKLGDPVPVPEPSEDAYGSVVGAIAREMTFSDGAAEAVRTAYSEWAREVQSKPLSGFGDFGATAANPYVRTLQAVLARDGLCSGCVDGIYNTALENDFRTWAARNRLDFGALLRGDATVPSLGLTAAALRAIAAVRLAWTQAPAAASLRTPAAVRAPVAPPTAVRTPAPATGGKAPAMPTGIAPRAPAGGKTPTVVSQKTPAGTGGKLTSDSKLPAGAKTPASIQGKAPAGGTTGATFVQGGKTPSETPVTQAQAVAVAQALLKQAGLYAGALDGVYSAAVETAFQTWATRNNTTVEKYLASAGQPLVKAALTAARKAFLAGAGAGAGGQQQQVATVTPAQAVAAAQTLLKKAGFYTGAVDGVYSGTLEYAFQAWAAKTGTTVEKYLASPDLPQVKAGIIAARKAFLAAGGTATPPAGTGGNGAATVTVQKAVMDLQAVLAKTGFISGTPDGIYNADLEIAFGNWAASTSTNIDTFLATAPGPYKIGIKAARDAYLKAGGVAYPAGIANAAGTTGTTGTTGTGTTTTTDTTGTTTTTTTTDTGTTATTTQPQYVPPQSDQGWYGGGGGGGGGGGEVAPVVDQSEEGAAPVPADQAMVKAEEAPAAPKSNTLRYVVIAGVLAAIGGAAWWYWKKRKAASAMMGEDGMELDGLNEETVETDGE